MASLAGTLRSMAEAIPLPAILLGLLLNVLDAVSYGLILFPWSSMPTVLDSSFAIHGISLFMTSTIISQLVLSLGGSAFIGANGSMMIEVIPFLHRITYLIAHRHPNAPVNSPIIVSTMLFCFALSTLLTGLAFLLLGVLRVGNFVNFFPRSFLIGAVGGIAVFLVQTAMEVASGTVWQWSLQFFNRLLDPNVLPIWLGCVALTVLLKLLQRRWKSSSLIPLYYLTVTGGFFLISMLICRFEAEELRGLRWLLSIDAPADGNGSGGAGWDLQTLLSLWLNHISFQSIDWPSVGAAMPTIGTLVLFGLLHVPLNLPSLALTVKRERFDINRELIGHGISNFMSGLAFSLQNYLVYCNSVLFIRAGGGKHRMAGVLLSVGTALIFLFGMQVVNFVPTMVVGSLILHLGVDLLWESVYDTRNMMSRLEYANVWLIILTMAIGNFTLGITIGLVASCLLFIYSYSRTVVLVDRFEHPEIGRMIGRKLSKDFHGISLLRLQGYLFFGNNYQLTRALNMYLAPERQTLLLSDGEFNTSDQRHYVLLDMQSVSGMDFSATAELLKFMRIFHTVNKEILLIHPQSTVYRDLLRRKLIRDPAEDDDFINSDENDTSAAAADLTRHSAASNTADNHHKVGCEVFESVESAVRWCELEWETDEVGRTYVDDLDAADHDYLPILTI